MFNFLKLYLNNMNKLYKGLLLTYSLIIPITIIPNAPSFFFIFLCYEMHIVSLNNSKKLFCSLPIQRTTIFYGSIIISLIQSLIFWIVTIILGVIIGILKQEVLISNTLVINLILTTLMGILISAIGISSYKMFIVIILLGFILAGIGVFTDISLQFWDIKKLLVYLFLILSIFPLKKLSLQQEIK